MSQDSDWKTILALVEHYDRTDARIGIHVHRHLYDVKLRAGDTPALKAAMNAWRRLERTMANSPGHDAGSERLACLAAFETLRRSEREQSPQAERDCP